MRARLAAEPEGSFYSIVNSRFNYALADPIGGGPGYSEIFRGGTYIVKDRTALATALDVAVSGDIIYVPENADIDMVGFQYWIPDAVLLVSNRGWRDSQGGMIRSSSTWIHDGSSVNLTIQSLTNGGGGTILASATNHKLFTGDKIFITSGLYKTTNAAGGPVTVTKTGTNNFTFPGTYIGDDLTERNFYEAGDAMLTMIGESTRISGLSLKGPTGERTTALASNQESAGVYTYNRFQRVDNCRMYNWWKWGIVVENNVQQRFDHNLFFNTQQDGFGYHIWSKTSGIYAVPTIPGNINDPDNPVEPAVNNKPEVTLKEANIAYNARHEFASAGSGNGAYIAQFNVIPQHSAGNHSYDRHAAGGRYTEISSNVHASRREAVMVSGFNATGAKGVHLKDNFTDYGNWDQVVPPVDQPFVGNTPFDDDETSTNTVLFGSWEAGERPKVTSITSDVSIATAPATVTFTAEGSDPTGNYPINAYIWEFDNKRDIHITSSNTFTKTYSTTGMKIVSVRVRNTVGIMSVAKGVYVDVNPISTSPPSLKQDLVDWWTFSEASGADRVGSHNGLIARQGSGANVTLVTGTGIGSGNACEFPGSNNAWLEFPQSIGTADANPDLEGIMLNDNPMSVSFWTYRISNASDETIWSSVRSRNQVICSQGTLRWQVASSEHGETNIQKTATGIPINTWIHVVLTWDPDNNIAKLYIDGVEEDSATIGHGSQADIDKFNEVWDMSSPVGFGVTQVNNDYNGRMAESAIWRKVITGSEITWLYNGGAGRTYTDIV